MIIKEFRELLRDRRTLAMLFVMLILLLFIFGYAANFSIDRVKVAIVGQGVQSYVDHVTDMGTVKDNVTIVEVDPNRQGEDNVADLFRDRTVDAVVSVNNDVDDTKMLTDQADVFIDGSSLFADQSAKKVFLQMNAEDIRA